MEEMQRGALNRCQGSHSGLTTVTPWKPETASLWPGKGGEGGDCMRMRLELFIHSTAGNGGSSGEKSQRKILRPSLIGIRQSSLSERLCQQLCGFSGESLSTSNRVLMPDKGKVPPKSKLVNQRVYWDDLQEHG